MHQTRISRPLYAAEVGTIRYVPVRLIKLGMVENIVNFTSKLQPIALSYFRVLQDSDVGLEFARTTANRAWGVSDGAEHDSTWIVRAKHLEVGRIRWVDAGSTERTRVETEIT
ncbi:MAG TPA: hypothetical protein VLC94_01910, partial [Candidatus Acidoferrum sp.]|nr:hypothetical protein [Candidatus Acidoferrum sp.]